MTTQRLSAHSFTLLLFELTRRDFKTRYLGSMLGSYWNLINPLVMVLIYTIVFSQVMHARMGSASGEAGAFAYSIYLCSGLLAWNLLSEVVNRGSMTLLDNATFIKKLSFPPSILFGSTLAAAVVNFLIAFSIFSLVLVFIKPVGFFYYAAYFGVIVLLSIFAFGLAVTVGCLNVFMRDFQQITSVIFQLWFWFTPIVYLQDVLPEFAKTALYFNPAFAYIESLHKLLYFGEWPPLRLLVLAIGWAALSVIVAVFTYRRTISLVKDQL